MEQNNKRKKILQVKDRSTMIEIPFGGYCANFEHFFEKRVNENFAATILQNVFGFQTVRHGHDGTEADLIFDKKNAFEITLVCDRKKHNNLIQRFLGPFQGHQAFKSSDIEGEVLSMIECCIAKKANKRYSNNDVNLCLISPFPMVDWIYENMDKLNILFVTPKTVIFRDLQDKYLRTNKFKNIYILLPDTDKSWWIIDLEEGRWQYKGTTLNENHPYFESTRLKIGRNNHIL